MANIIEEFITARGYAFDKTVKPEDQYGIKHETYELSGDETLDGLKLKITVETVYAENSVPVAQDFFIKSNRGAVRRADVNEVFQILRLFL